MHCLGDLGCNDVCVKEVVFWKSELEPVQSLVYALCVIVAGAACSSEVGVIRSGYCVEEMRAIDGAASHRTDMVLAPREV